VFIERLWRSVKYEEVYLKDYASVWEAEASLAGYFRFYCHERSHQALSLPHAGRSVLQGGVAGGLRTGATWYKINTKSRATKCANHLGWRTILSFSGRARPSVWVSRAATP